MERVDINKIDFSLLIEVAKPKKTSLPYYLVSPKYDRAVELNKHNLYKEVIRIVSSKLGINPIVRTRVTPYKEARFIIFYILKNFCPGNFSLKEIGAPMGLDHSTVHNGIKKVEEFVQVDRKFAEKLKSCIAEYKQHFQVVEAFEIDFNSIPQY